MRQSKLFAKTVREVPKDVGNKSTEYFIRAGFIAESVAGRYYLLPLGLRVQEKIMNIVEEEMNAIGAQKMSSPTLHPIALWEETNRTSSVGFELMKVRDRRGAAFALGGTAEEMFVDLVRKYTFSYRDLPFTLYQFSQKFRDELRARGGLLRVREFMMKDAYSFHRNEADFKREYEAMWQAYTRIFARLGLTTISVESDNGYIGGEYCHEFIVVSQIGESKFLYTEDRSYAAHEDVAIFQKDQKNITDEFAPMRDVEAIRGPTMEEGVALHQLPLWQQIKDVLFVDDQGRFILAIIRGDYDVNETKLKNCVGAVDLRHAEETEIQSMIHSEAGFISPVDIKNIAEKSVKIIIVADDSLRTIRNAYGGANKKHTDMLNMNIDRDYQVDIEADIALAKAGYVGKNGEVLQSGLGIEVGNIFQLGEHYSSRMHATFVDEDGAQKNYYMGCYGIGIGRTMATVVEESHDEHGIIWPQTIAPYQIHLISLCREPADVTVVDALYEELVRAHIEVLYDDRTDLRGGEKFADSDLIGIPTRIIVSPKTLAAHQVEIKNRRTGETRFVERQALVSELSAK